ncbi:1,6-anhydro-N-acetylmuramyl-L-alanine amidase AmpD [Nymphon striatum]|nr:1,6-anhydro-N-acetylmuramyl-L-alanine amidase AmpD [Nymphon striatum]
MFLSDDMLNAIPAVPPPMAEVPLGNSTDIVIYDVQNQEETVILNDNQGNNNEVSGTAEPYTGLLPTTLPSGSESVLGTDGRTQITNTTDFPWRTIVRLSVKYPNSSSIFLCSGSVVDNFHVLTAGHCIHNASLGGWAEVIGVYPGQDGSYTPYYKSNPTNLRSYTGWTSSQSPDHDWGLITLDRNIGAHVGWMGRQTADSTNAIYTGNLNVSGYPGDKPSGTHWYDSDTGHSATDTRHFYFMDTFGGQSGSPVWRYDGTNRYILSIHAYGDYAGTPGVSNGGTRLNTDKYNTLTTWLGSDTAPTDKPDLIDDGNLYSGFSPTSVSAGDSFSAYMDVRNIGTASSGGFYVTFYASTNTTITSGDYYLGQVYVPSISAFQWSDANWSGTFPSGIPAGSYYVGWVIDSGGASNEFDETNNTAYKASPKLTVTASVTTPGAATLVSPSGTITDSTPTYTWNAVSGATYYYLYVNDSTGNVIETWYTAAAAGCSSGTGTYARINLSPNQDIRPNQNDISLIVIHNISLPPNEFGGDGIDQLFTNTLDKDEHPFYEEIHELRVSSHLLIRRDGEVVQYVSFNKRAWHAGESEFLGRSVCNDFSIGIEMEGTDFEPFTDIQYEQLGKTLQTLLNTYPSLSPDSITGHEHIAPGRKTDPGPYFEWQRLEKDWDMKTLNSQPRLVNEYAG